MQRSLLSLLAGAPLIASLILFTACGGGGGSSGGAPPATPQTLSPDAAPAATITTVNIFPIALRTMRHVESATPVRPTGVSQTTFQNAASALNDFLQALLANYLSTLTQPSTTTTCSGGGSIATTTDTTAGTVITTSYSNCITSIDTNADGIVDASLYRNGVASFTMSNTLLDYASGITTRVTRLSDNRVLWEEVLTGMNIHVRLISTRDCLGNPYAASAELTVNGTNSVKVDSDADGAWDTDQSVVFNSFFFGFINTTMDSQTCRPVSGTFTRITDLGVPVILADNVQVIASMQSTIPVNSPTHQLHVEWVDTSGNESLNISGDFAIDTSCGRTTLSVATATPLDVPIGSYCATTGAMVVSGDASATIHFAGMGGIQIDRGSDGSIDATFSSCNLTATCR